jgi:mRNA-degrading endonuclease RelE of RelBE toxin-antitoxin system
MNYNIFPTRRFEKELKHLVKKYPSLKVEYAKLIDILQEVPQTGVSLGCNCHKIRLSIASKGKGRRSGARVITCFYVHTQTVYLLSIYDKSEMEDLKDNVLKNIIEELGLE